jgi:hypothetical protein
MADRWSKDFFETGKKRLSGDTDVELIWHANNSSSTE